MNACKDAGLYKHLQTHYSFPWPEKQLLHQLPTTYKSFLPNRLKAVVSHYLYDLQTASMYMVNNEALANQELLDRVFQKDELKTQTSPFKLDSTHLEDQLNSEQHNLSGEMYKVRLHCHPIIPGILHDVRLW